MSFSGKFLFKSGLKPELICFQPITNLDKVFNFYFNCVVIFAWWFHAFFFSSYLFRDEFSKNESLAGYF